MASRGQAETSKLLQNLQDQLERLVRQLEEIEESKELLDAEEYAETKKETIEQLKEMNESLAKMKQGNLSLVDELNGFQIAIQAAIGQAFKTPEVINLFVKKQPAQLRQKLAQVERDAKIGKLPKDSAEQQKVEILLALKKLGDPLTAEETCFLQSRSTAVLKDFEQVDDSRASGDKVLRVVGSEVQQYGAQ